MPWTYSAAMLNFAALINQQSLRFGILRHRYFRFAFNRDPGTKLLHAIEFAVELVGDVFS
jgi:hypothetical protein